MSDASKSLVRSIKTKQCIVAFIDILGCKRLIQEEKEGEVLNLIYDVYQMIKSDARYRKLFGPERHLQFFSDNFIIAEEFNDSEELVESFLRLIKTIQFMFLPSGLYLRGGIDIGQFYIDETFVWGKALLQTYTLESSKAVYPRIILGSAAKATKYFRQGESHKKFLAKDSDGEIFVNYFDFEGDDDGRFPILLTQIKKKLIESMDNTLDSKVKDKLMWMVEKYNNECNRTRRNSDMID